MVVTLGQQYNIGEKPTVMRLTEQLLVQQIVSIEATFPSKALLILTLIGAVQV